MTRSAQTGRAGFVTIIGRPNVGKSTLLNRILGEKLAIVSNRPQTTRNRILGIHSWRDEVGATNQMVLIDTPGLHRRRANLNRFMVQQAVDSIGAVDVVLLMTDAPRTVKPRKGESKPRPPLPPSLHPQDRFVLEQLRLHAPAVPVVVALNKIDRLRDRRQLLPQIELWAAEGMACIVPISARTGEQVPGLTRELVDRLPAGEPLYPTDLLTDQAERFSAAELIREQVFLRCDKEIPYSTAVEVTWFQERRHRRDVCIEAVIHVEQPGQRGILIGARGSMIRDIGTAAREEISRALGCKVHLGLTVHVEPNWSRRPDGRRKLGYE